jgi:hypothetical protein
LFGLGGAVKRSRIGRNIPHDVDVVYSEWWRLHLHVVSSLAGKHWPASVFVHFASSRLASFTRPRSPTECVRSRKTEVNGEVHGGRPRPTGAVVPRGEKKDLFHYTILLENECT